MAEARDPDSLSVIGHLDELRRRILIALAALAGGTGLGLWWATPLIRFLQRAAWVNVQTFILVKPTEVISLYLKVALYVGAIVGSPVILYQAWRFIRPAIPKDVKFSLFGWVASGAVLFMAGTVFAYFVLIPQGLGFLLGLSRQVATPLLNLNDYLSFVLALLVMGGVIFEIPLLVGLLTKVELLTPRWLRRRRKEAFFALCVAAAVITPTTDAFNMIIFAVPMLALYELGIWVSVLLAPRPKKLAEDGYHENP